MIDKHSLGMFNGTENWHRYSPLFRTILLTDGVKYVADNGGIWRLGAYWLMDAIASHQPDLLKNPDQRLREMQFWKLKVNSDESALLTCQADSGEPFAVQQKIPFTDFDLDEIDIWVQASYSFGTRRHYVLMLPSEY